jgi:hypothetical protein
MTDDDADTLAARLAGYAASVAPQDRPQMQRDLQAASEQVSDFQALLRVWRAALDHLETALERHIGHEFAELLGANGMTEAWKRRLQLKVITGELLDTQETEAGNRRLQFRVITTVDVGSSLGPDCRSNADDSGKVKS